MKFRYLHKIGYYGDIFINRQWLENANMWKYENTKRVLRPCNNVHTVVGGSRTFRLYRLI